MADGVWKQALLDLALDWANGRVTLDDALEIAWGQGYSQAMADDQTRGER